MATKKTKSWPKITKGNHSTIIEYENGNFEIDWNWEQLNKDINNAIRVYEQRTDKAVGEQGKKTSTKKG